MLMNSLAMRNIHKSVYIFLNTMFMQLPLKTPLCKLFQSK